MVFWRPVMASGKAKLAPPLMYLEINSVMMMPMPMARVTVSRSAPRTDRGRNSGSVAMVNTMAETSITTMHRGMLFPVWVRVSQPMAMVSTTMWE